VSITGIAGPDGGTASKPVGLTYLGLATAAGVDVRRFVFPGDRGSVRAGAAGEALTWLIAAAEAGG
jgi:nicotinamide mononucleotide (NMN) deamidase PncC